jgi:hypothetical protein
LASSYLNRPDGHNQDAREGAQGVLSGSHDPGREGHLKGDQRAAQTLINLMRELDILKPQKAFDPLIFTLNIGRPGDKSKE